MATIAEQYSEYAATFACNDIPEAVRRRACHLILDSAGVALAASTYDFAHRTVNALAGLGRGDSDVIGMSVKLPLRDAVLANGALIHGIDFDDTHKQGNIHITSSCFPTALATMRICTLAYMHTSIHHTGVGMFSSQNAASNGPGRSVSTD